MLIEMEPQIANSRIDELSLHILQIAANPLAVFNLCRDSAKDVSVQLSTNILVDSGCALPLGHAQAEQEAVSHPDAAPWREIVMSDPRNESLRGISFVTTVKGKLAQRLPLGIQCSLVVVAGVMFSLESVMCLASAIIGSGTPFYSMVDDDNKQAKRKAADDAGRLMGTLSHGLASDIVAALNATLQYKKMTSEGLGEADEEQWCASHMCSRIRLQNIVKLEAQIKEQLGGMVTFVDIDDVSEMIAVVQDSARLIQWLVSSAYFDHAIFVEHDTIEAQRRKKAGTSLFLTFDALCDFHVASCVKWQQGTIVLPMILQPRYDKLFGTFANRLETWEFNTLLMLLSFAVFFDPEVKTQGPPAPDGTPGGPVPPYFLMGIELHTRKMVFALTEPIAKAVLQFRAGYGARMRQERTILVDHVRISDTEGLKATNAAAGLPADITPTQLGTKLGEMLTRVLTAVKPAHPGAQPAVKPYFGPFAPSKVSMILSAGPTTVDFVPGPAPAAAPAGDVEVAGAPAAAIIEEEE